MGTRRSAATLSTAEITRFIDAVKALKVPDPATGISEYDRFVALHGAVMRVRVLFVGGDFQDTNMAHWDIGFCPWHRHYLLMFEQALQRIDAEVDLPYWDWENHSGAMQSLFADAFIGSLGPVGAPADVTDGQLAPFQVAAPLEEIWGPVLERGGGASIGWPPPPGSRAWLEDLRVGDNGSHALWIFWQLLEAGWGSFVSHNAGHRYIGGHMTGDFSPNDVTFWMHHANVDRIWANWQNRYLLVTGAAHPADWPDPAESSSMTGNPAPYGHRTNDIMWPWVGGFADSFTSLSATTEQLAMMHDPATLPVVRVADVLDITTLGYDYAN